MKTQPLNVWCQRHVVGCLAAMTVCSMSVAGAATYSATVLADNPVGYWRLEELSSAESAADSSVSGQFPGSYTGSPVLGLPGIETNCIRLPGPGTSSPITIGNYAELNPQGPFSFEIWARPNTSDPVDYRCPIGNFGGWGNPSGWYIYQSPGGGNTAFTLVMQPANAWIGNVPCELYKWYHLVGTYDGTTAKFYVNGQLKGSAPVANTSGYLANSATPLSLGGRGEGAYGWWDGNLDEAAIYASALTEEQVATHYQVGTNSFYTPPQAPSFTLQPVSSTNYSGTQVQFKSKADGFPTLISYQWYKGSSRLSGETNAIYSFICSLSDDQTTYKVVAENGINPPATSSIVTLTVVTNLEIYVEPASIARTEGTHSKAAFIALARGAQPLTYQWYRGTSKISGATNPTLWLSGLTVSGDGGSTYHCEVTTPYGVAVTANATLTVQPRAVDVPIAKYAKVVLADDPVGYWRLDEADGTTIATDAVGSFDGAYTPGSGSIVYSVPTGIPYETNTAVKFADGATVRIPYALELNPFGPFTAEFWLQPSRQALPGDDYRTPIASQRSGDGPIGWHLYLLPDDTFTWVLHGGHWANWWVGAAMAPVVANNWYHLALTYDGSAFVIYVNGAAAGSGAVPGFVVAGNKPAADNPGPYAYTYDGTGDFTFGWRSDNDWKPYPGAIDDVAIYNKALSAEQVKLHYSSTVRLTISKDIAGKVVLSWPFGALQAGPAVTGVYTNVPGVTSPLTNSPAGSATFYRVQVQ